MTSRQSRAASSALRFYICGLAVFNWYFAYAEERSFAYAIAAYPEGAFVYWMLFVCGTIGILDVVINDMRTVPQWLALQRNRHFGFLAIAFGHACLVFIAVLKLNSAPLAIFSVWNVGFIVGFSLFDAHARSAAIIKEQAAYASRHAT